MNEQKWLEDCRPLSGKPVSSKPVKKLWKRGADVAGEYMPVDVDQEEKAIKPVTHIRRHAIILIPATS